MLAVKDGGLGLVIIWQPSGKDLGEIPAITRSHLLAIVDQMNSNCFTVLQILQQLCQNKKPHPHDHMTKSGHYLYLWREEEVLSPHVRCLDNKVEDPPLVNGIHALIDLIHHSERTGSVALEWWASVRTQHQIRGFTVIQFSTCAYTIGYGPYVRRQRSRKAQQTFEISRLEIQWVTHTCNAMR